MDGAPAEQGPRARSRWNLCESCHRAMSPRTMRQRDSRDRLVCPSCKMDDDRLARATGSAREADWGHHLMQRHGWTPEDVAMAHPRDLFDLHAELHSIRNRDVLLPPTHEHEDHNAMRRVAHDSQDDSLIAHCPYDGSGQVIGSPDGTITCGYCGRAFTVRLQPVYPAMPQTDPATGMPLPIPGMPPPAASQAPPGAPGAAPGPLGAPTPAPAAGVAPGAGAPTQEPTPMPDDSMTPLAVRALAIRCAPDPARVLAEIAMEHARHGGR